MIEEVGISTLVQGYNPRKSLGDLESLKNSIKEVGMLNPLLVRPLNGGFQIIAGHRRWMAAKDIGLEKIPCIVKEISDDDAFHLAFVDNKERNNLNALEEAEHYSACCKKGMTVREIGEKYQVEYSGVSDRIKLLVLPQPIKDFLLVHTNKFTMNHAFEIAKICNPEDLKKLFEESQEDIDNWEEAFKKELEIRQKIQIDLANKVKEEGISVKTLKEYIKKVNTDFKKRDRNIVELTNIDEPPVTTPQNQVTNKPYIIPSGIHEKIKKGILDIHDLRILLKEVTEQLLIRGEYQNIIDTEIKPILAKYEE